MVRGNEGADAPQDGTRVGPQAPAGASGADPADAAARWARERVWAVVGASNARHKFGNRIYRTLRDAGYRVYAVNRTAASVEGDAAYARLVDLPEPPTVVDLVIPPGAGTLDVVRDARAAGARAVWFQPGAEDEAAMRWAESKGLAVVTDCILRRYVEQGALGRP